MPLRSGKMSLYTLKESLAGFNNIHLHFNKARITTDLAWNLRYYFRFDNFKFYNLFYALRKICFAYLDQTNKLSGKQLNGLALPSQHRNSLCIGRFLLNTSAATKAWLLFLRHPEELKTINLINSTCLNNQCNRRKLLRALTQCGLDCSVPIRTNSIRSVQ